MENQKRIAEAYINKALYEYNVEDYGLIVGLILMAHKLGVLTDPERNTYINKLNKIKFDKRAKK